MAQLNPIDKKYLINFLEQLNQLYRQTKSERKQLATISTTDEEFTALEEIELLTVELRGYASQLEARGGIENAEQVINKLRIMRIFAVPVIAKLYFEAEEYNLIKSYIRMLDYLRLLILEYLQ
ncbi:hypothetical protein H6G72_24240 [Planktothricoides sp. FACHB-1370]|uniref:Uncharacterized protein n=1 Tax=Planktothricoides raciborskii FACHB-1370 TaxID=2949576 RepID=A0ABR8EMT2_9CYAN|nr:hypothetical protein [Planktothricoides raciborskii FACHB-1370]MBD2585323.1 hypothetical protein [Planktothricoides raciborskii FACHB-1261]